jgi:hypothetical protein
MSRKPVILFALLTMALASVALSCSGSQATPQMPGPPDPTTRATLAGPLCDTAECQCSEDPAKIGLAEPGLKRFRVELGPSESELWTTIGKNVMYKGKERATACFYVDLAAGEHPIGLRARGAGGFGAGMRISEIGGRYTEDDEGAEAADPNEGIEGIEGVGYAEGGEGAEGAEPAEGAEGAASVEESPGVGLWLYETLDFNCGAPGLCDMQSLRDWKKSISHVSAGKHAPCGSVRILGIDWTTGRMPDMLHPEDFRLEATMKIYKFLPDNPPGTESCTKE